ncbi:MAG: ROK family protein [Candidatus Rokubacteria bacterium]|nr:ROK family protein [Candidatus Rokubacteria bacterium]
MRREAILAVDVGGTSIAAGLVAPDGEILGQLQAPTRERGTALDTLNALLDELLAAARGRGLRVLGLGAGVPGAVDATTGVVGEDVQNVPELARLPLTRHLRARFGLPAFVDNDVNALALGEWTFGRARGARSLVLLAIGTGVGGGIILDGQLVRGAAGYGGELGHISVNFDGRPCFCGGRGCLKAYVAGPDIAAAARARLETDRDSRLLALAGGDPDAVSAAHVFRAAGDGDRLAGALVEEICQALGAGLAAIVNALNPEVILVTGGVAESLKPLEAAILRWTGRYAFARALAATRMTVLVLDKHATVRGGAALFLYERSRSRRPTRVERRGSQRRVRSGARRRVRPTRRRSGRRR